MYRMHPVKFAGSRHVTARLKDHDLAALRHNALLSALSDEDTAILLSEAVETPYGKGEMLFLQGDDATSFFLVLGGWIKVFRMTPGGEEAVVGVFTRGQNFAEAAAFAGTAYPASAEAVTEARVLRIPMRWLHERIAHSPQIGIAMLASLSRHLRQLVLQIEQLKAHTGAQRVAEFLVSLAPAHEGACEITLPYEKSLLAGKLGIKPESLSRAFQRLKSCGVTINRDVAKIRDVGCLLDFMDQERAEILKPVNRD